jgi:hypothetical protein
MYEHRAAMKLEDGGFISQRANTILYAPLIPLAAIPGARSFMGGYIFHVWHADTMGDNTI